jgi:hypothetical protein
MSAGGVPKARYGTTTQHFTLPSPFLQDYTPSLELKATCPLGYDFLVLTFSSFSASFKLLQEEKECWWFQNNQSIYNHESQVWKVEGLQFDGVYQVTWGPARLACENLYNLQGGTDTKKVKNNSRTKKAAESAYKHGFLNGLAT